MQTNSRKSVDKKLKTKEKSKDDLATKKPEEKPKKSLYSVSTPRSFMQKTTAADIYAKKNAVQGVNAPKKPLAPSRLSSNVSPMKDLLRSSSSVSQLSRSSKTPNKIVALKEGKVQSARSQQNIKSTPRKETNRKLPVNVTVNSPIAKRKLNLEQEKEKVSKESKEVKLKTESNKEVEVQRRQRTKTRTLDEDEVKVLTVDNNAEMLNLAKKLNAQPKAFYVDLNGETQKEADKSEEEVSYEDDFESYESDFESYKSSHAESPSSSKLSDGESDNMDNEEATGCDDGNSKEERMLDSGHFDLRDPRSANRNKPMDFISESEEGDKKASLTDEGFQDMSSSSGLSSMKTLHIDILERPLFIDFTKSKENRRKRRIYEKLKQRAHDILNMVTLHEMSYSLFEMKPIPYELYMATFGRSNYTQAAVQTFEDGITESIQTEEIEYKNKWSQYPVEFSKELICLNLDKENHKKQELNGDEFKFLFEQSKPVNIDEAYKSNNLRIYLEQKNGVGSDEILPYDNYESKLKNTHYNVSKLRKFLKNVESKISNILSVNAGSTEMTNFVKTSKFPFSDSYISINPKSLTNEKLLFVKDLKITGVVFSNIKSNLLMSIHKKTSTGIIAQKCIVCMWDLSAGTREPLKVLIATDDVNIGLFHGSIDGFFIGALNDGTIHLWDLSEEATWYNDIASSKEPTKVVEIDSKNLTSTEMDREWNLKNRDVGLEQDVTMVTLQACAYTSSAKNVCNNEPTDYIVGLEFVGNESTLNLDVGKLIGQIAVLQKSGILIIWSIIHEKSKTVKPDIGKAFWSKFKLEKSQTIDLTEFVGGTIDIEDGIFNLNAAKKRLASKRIDKSDLKEPRPSSSRDSKFRIDVRPKSAASLKKSRMLVENIFCETTIICNDLKVLNLDKTVSYLVGKNGGEVLCCSKIAGTVKVNTIQVANSASSVTKVVASPHGLPYFLAATDCGTINMCSVLDSRVLLTMDCRNTPVSVSEKYHTDHKGRFAGSFEDKSSMGKENYNKATMLPINSLIWSHSDPFCIIALLPNGAMGVWELTHSDIHAKCLRENSAVAYGTTDRALALITPENEIQVYKLLVKPDRLDLFQKYVALL